FSNSMTSSTMSRLSAPRSSMKLASSVSFSRSTPSSFSMMSRTRCDIIEKELGVEREKLTDDASFIEDLGADSLDIVELVMEFEKEFNIDIPDEDAEKLRTVGDAIGYLNQKMGSAAK